MASSNGSCGSFPVTIGPLCSGNGDCVYSAVYGRDVCQCYPGFRGNSDFQASSSLVDCHISEVSIIVLWSVQLALLVVATLFSLHNFRQIKMSMDEQNARLRAAGKREQSVRANKAFAALIPYFVLGLPSLYAIAILRITAQASNVIGKDWGVTVCWFLMRASFYAAAMRFQPALIESLLRGQRACEELMWRNNMMANAVLLLTIASMLVVLVPLLLVPTDPFDFFWGRFAYVFICVGLVFAMSISTFQAKFATKKIEEVLLVSYENNKDERVLQIAIDLKSLQRHLIKQQTVQIVLQGFVALAPFMWTKHDYILLITASSTVIIGAQALRTVTKIQLSAIQRGNTASKDLRLSKEREIAVAPGGQDDSTNDGNAKESNGQ